MAHCDEYIELISAAIDGALSPAELEKLAAHLASCSECKALYEELTVVHAALLDLPPVEVPAGLTDHIMAAVAAEQIVPLEKKKPSIRWQKWLATAAVLAVVVAGTWSWKPWERNVAGAPGSAAPAVMQSTVTDSSEALSQAIQAVEAAPESEAEEAALERALVEPAGGEASDSANQPAAPVLPTGGRSAAKAGAEAQEDMVLPTADEDIPAQAPEESGKTALQMSRMLPKPKSVINGGDGGGELALPTEAPQEEVAVADLEEAAPEPQPLMMMAAGTTMKVADPEKLLTVQEALDLVVERCFGDSGYEMLREDLEGDIPSCYVSLMDNGVLVADGAIVYTGETEDFFLFECHWGDIPEEPYHYSVHKTEGYVAWQGDAPIDGEFRP